MNLKKFTKAELISKLNNIKQTNNNKDSIFNNLMTILLLIKSFILKITLIAFIIKIFRKYSIFRKIFAVINTILFSIFGISVIDFYEIEVISKYFHKIMDIFANFHSSILELFGKKEDIVQNLPSSSMRGIPKETNGIQANNENSNGIIERYKKLIHREEIKPEITQEEENTPYYKNKYVIIASLLILSGITWYFYDDIRPVGSSLLAWINVFKSRRNDDPGDINPNVQVNSNWNLNKLKDSIKNKVYGEPKDEDISFQKSPESVKLGESSKTEEMDHYFPEPSKGKAVDLRNLSQTELERRGIDSQMTGLSEITALPENFEPEGGMLLKEINSFTTLYVEDRFPRTQLAQANYEILNRRIENWSKSNPELFAEFMKNQWNKEVIDKFSDLRADVYLFSVSDTYSDVEKAASEEQEIWSERANTPQQVLSPELVAETAMETMNKPKLVVETIDNNQKTEENVNTNETLTPLDKLNKYWEGLKSKTKEILNKDENINNNVKTEDTILEEDGLLLEEIATEEVSTLALLKDKDNPKIEISKHSTPEDMKDYFIKEESNNTVEETKPIEDSKIEIIHSEELDNLAKTLTPRIKDDYIEPDNTKIFENLDPELLPEKEDKKTKLISSFKNIKDNQKAEGLFSQETTSLIKEELSKENDLLYSKDNINKTLEERPHIVEALKAIKSKRLEYGSPSVANIGLPKGDLSPLIQNENISNLPNDNEGIDDSNPEKEVKLPLHNWNEEIKFNINKGQPYERFIDIELGENQKDIYKILIITNDGMSNSINPNTVVSLNHKNSFKWDVKGTSNSYWRDLDIYSISIIDKNSATTTLYTNKNIKFLNVFKDNISKGFK